MLATFHFPCHTPPWIILQFWIVYAHPPLSDPGIQVAKGIAGRALRLVCRHGGAGTAGIVGIRGSGRWREARRRRRRGENGNYIRGRRFPWELGSGESRVSGLRRGAPALSLDTFLSVQPSSSEWPGMSSPHSDRDAPPSLLSRLTALLRWLWLVLGGEGAPQPLVEPLPRQAQARRLSFASLREASADVVLSLRAELPAELLADADARNSSLIRGIRPSVDRRSLHGLGAPSPIPPRRGFGLPPRLLRQGRLGRLLGDGQLARYQASRPVADAQWEAPRHR